MCTQDILFVFFTLFQLYCHILQKSTQNHTYGTDLAVLFFYSFLAYNLLSSLFISLAMFMCLHNVYSRRRYLSYFQLVILEQDTSEHV